MRTANAQVWVVYSTPMKNCPEGLRAVCEQAEWEVMEQAKPGFYTLIQGEISNEGEAERLARGNAGAAVPRNSKMLPKTWPDEVAAVLTKPTAG